MGLQARMLRPHVVTEQSDYHEMVLIGRRLESGVWQETESRDSIGRKNNGMGQRWHIAICNNPFGCSAEMVVQLDEVTRELADQVGLGDGPPRTRRASSDSSYPAVTGPTNYRKVTPNG